MIGVLLLFASSCSPDSIQTKASSLLFDTVVTAMKR